MTEKFVLTDKQERILLDNKFGGMIYSAVKFENVSASFLQVEKIVAHGIGQNVSAQDVEIILIRNMPLSMSQPLSPFRMMILFMLIC
ncbi:hypothetical protein PQ472_10730 [Lacticaseibacillus pabuli]|uniref:Uncharacterized protein n=1 Tax=Lacticaseibacillus pabuli TaxID=3025672 RepID=A0ABY7WQG5_9LACO|nr:hypothetical protein [Lacticaseibacillus sp. KACC 23028]WDF82351.1 hypothetical protein PQ472_10730 [Lacticaseibacillus sp. KACC 23028]